MKIWSKINYITKSLQIVFKITQITIRERERERYYMSVINSLIYYYIILQNLKYLISIS